MIVLQIDKPIPIPLWESTEPVATENIRNNVRVQTMSEIFDTEGYVVWMISDGKLRSLVTLIRWNHQTEERKWLLW